MHTAFTEGFVCELEKLGDADRNAKMREGWNVGIREKAAQRAKERDLPIAGPVAGGAIGSVLGADAGALRVNELEQLLSKKHGITPLKKSVSEFLPRLATMEKLRAYGPRVAAGVALGGAAGLGIQALHRHSKEKFRKNLHEMIMRAEREIHAEHAKHAGVGSALKAGLSSLAPKALAKIPRKELIGVGALGAGIGGAVGLHDARKIKKEAGLIGAAAKGIGTFLAKRPLFSIFGLLPAITGAGKAVTQRLGSAAGEEASILGTRVNQPSEAFRANFHDLLPHNMPPWERFRASQFAPESGWRARAARREAQGATT